jgi:hypothetical protein
MPRLRRAAARIGGRRMTAIRITGRTWAYGGALLGGAVSIAANVAHSYVPPAGTDPGWAPHAGAVVGAVFWPVALFVAIEILARTPWPSTARWTALRFAGLLPVAVVAAVVSYRHLSGLLAFYREDSLTATIGPLAVDGLMVMATGALIATAAHRADGAAEGRDRSAETRSQAPDRSADRTPVPPPSAVPGQEDRPGTFPAAGPHVVRRAAPGGPERDAPVRTVARRVSGPDAADLLLLGRAIAADLARDGRPLTRAALVAGVRARGHGISTGRATELLRRLRDTATEPAA